MLTQRPIRVKAPTGVTTYALYGLDGTDGGIKCLGLVI